MSDEDAKLEAAVAIMLASIRSQEWMFTGESMVPLAYAFFHILVQDVVALERRNYHAFLREALEETIDKFAITEGKA